MPEMSPKARILFDKHDKKWFAERVVELEEALDHANADIAGYDASDRKQTTDNAALQRQVEKLPGIKIADGTVWLVFPGAIISIDAVGTGRGLIVKKNLRAWKDRILQESQESDDI